MALGVGEFQRDAGMTAPHNPYEVHPRKPLTQKQKLQLFIEEGGICCVCGLKIDGVKEAWDEHKDALWLNGTNERKNRGVAHIRCARVKTDKEATERAKSRAVAEKHFGARTPKTKAMPCGRRSPWKKKMDGSVVRR